MATGPVQDPSDSRSIGQDPDTLRFRRLERVRRGRQTRRRRRLILAMLLVLGVAGAGIVGFTSIVQQSVQHGRDHLAVPPAAATIPTSPETVLTPAMPAAVTGAVTTVPAPPASAPARTRAEGVKREPVQRLPPRSDPARDAAPAAEPPEPDPAAVVDWLLRGSRTRAQ